MGDSDRLRSTAELGSAEIKVEDVPDGTGPHLDAGAYQRGVRILHREAVTKLVAILGVRHMHIRWKRCAVAADRGIHDASG